MRRSRIFTDKALAESATVELDARNNHYLMHDWFLKPKQMVLKSNIKKVKHIPTTFVHGRFDFICPMEMAWEMHKQLPKSKMVVVQAGHSVCDKEVAHALVKASDDFKL